MNLLELGFTRLQVQVLHPRLTGRKECTEPQRASKRGVSSASRNCGDCTAANRDSFSSVRYTVTWC